MAAEEARSQGKDSSSVGMAKAGTFSSLHSAKEKGPTSLFLFQEDNVVRRYAKMMSEWVNINFFSKS